MLGFGVSLSKCLLLTEKTRIRGWEVGEIWVLFRSGEIFDVILNRDRSRPMSY
jgi:hypothetical protein